MITKNNSVLRGKIYRLLQFIVVTCIFLIPFIKTSNGNSLFRFDVFTLRLYAFNSIVDFTSFFNAFIFILLITFLFVFITQLIGRVWCGWFCPQSFFSIRIESYIKKYKNKTIRYIIQIILAILFALIFTVICMMYFVSPYDFVYTIKHSNIMLLIGIVLFLFVFIDLLLVRFKWCKYICPYSKFQVVMTDDDTLYVGMIPEKQSLCIDCKSCVRVCPTHIDPRKNPDADCIYCETCVTACNKIFHKQNNTEGVLGYVWGKSNKLNLKRPNLVATFIVSLSLFSILIYSLVFNSEPVIINFSSIYLVGDTYAVDVKIKNNLDKPIRVTFTNPDELVDITPNMIKVYIKSSKEETIYIYTKEEIPNGELLINAYYGTNHTPLTFKLNLNK